MVRCEGCRGGQGGRHAEVQAHLVPRISAVGKAAGGQGPEWTPHQSALGSGLLGGGARAWEQTRNSAPEKGSPGMHQEPECLGGAMSPSPSASVKQAITFPVSQDGSGTFCTVSIMPALHRHNLLVYFFYVTLYHQFSPTSLCSVPNNHFEKPLTTSNVVLQVGS